MAENLNKGITEFDLEKQMTKEEISAKAERVKAFSYQNKRNMLNGSAQGDAVTQAMNQRLLDVRNYRNFRSTKNSYGIYGDVDAEKTISTSYLCSAKDFLYSETMELTDSSSVDANVFKPRIQTLIINEYQPYVADYGMVQLARVYIRYS